MPTFQSRHKAKKKEIKKPVEKPVETKGVKEKKQ